MKRLLMSMVLLIGSYAVYAQQQFHDIHNNTDCGIWATVYCYDVPCVSDPPPYYYQDTYYIPANSSLPIPTCNCPFYPPGTPPPVPYCAQAVTFRFETTPPSLCPESALMLMGDEVCFSYTRAQTVSVPNCCTGSGISATARVDFLNGIIRIDF